MAKNHRLACWEEPMEPQALNKPLFRQWRYRILKHRKNVQTARPTANLAQYEKEVTELEKANSGRQRSRKFRLNEEEADLRKNNERLVQRLCDVAKQSERRQVKLAAGTARNGRVLVPLALRLRQRAIDEENARMFKRLRDAKVSVPNAVQSARSYDQHVAISAQISRVRRPVHPLRTRTPRRQQYGQLQQIDQGLPNSTPRESPAPKHATRESGRKPKEPNRQTEAAVPLHIPVASPNCMLFGAPLGPSHDLLEASVKQSAKIDDEIEESFETYSENDEDASSEKSYEDDLASVSDHASSKSSSKGDSPRRRSTTSSKRSSKGDSKRRRSTASSKNSSKGDSPRRRSTASSICSSKADSPRRRSTASPESSSKADSPRRRSTTADSASSASKKSGRSSASDRSSLKSAKSRRSAISSRSSSSRSSDRSSSSRSSRTPSPKHTTSCSDHLAPLGQRSFEDPLKHDAGHGIKKQNDLHSSEDEAKLEQGVHRPTLVYEEIVAECSLAGLEDEIPQTTFQDQARKSHPGVHACSNIEKQDALVRDPIRSSTEAQDELKNLCEGEREDSEGARDDSVGEEANERTTDEPENSENGIHATSSQSSLHDKPVAALAVSSGDSPHVHNSGVSDAIQLDVRSANLETSPPLRSLDSQGSSRHGVNQRFSNPVQESQEDTMDGVGRMRQVAAEAHSTIDDALSSHHGSSGSEKFSCSSEDNLRREQPHEIGVPNARVEITQPSSEVPSESGETTSVPSVRDTARSAVSEQSHEKDVEIQQHSSACGVVNDRILSSEVSRHRNEPHDSVTDAGIEIKQAPNAVPSEIDETSSVSSVHDLPQLAISEQTPEKDIENQQNDPTCRYMNGRSSLSEDNVQRNKPLDVSMPNATAEIKQASNELPSEIDKASSPPSEYVGDTGDDTIEEMDNIISDILKSTSSSPTSDRGQTSAPAIHTTSHLQSDKQQPVAEAEVEPGQVSEEVSENEAENANEESFEDDFEEEEEETHDLEGS